MRAGAAIIADSGVISSGSEALALRTMESITLQGRLVRLEPLAILHAEALAAAASADRDLYRWSPVPQSPAEAVRYIQTALDWQKAGTAVPFAILRNHDDTVIGSTRF